MLAVKEGSVRPALVVERSRSPVGAGDGPWEVLARRVRRREVMDQARRRVMEADGVQVVLRGDEGV